MAVNMIAMAVVSLVITGISKLITYQQDCIDKANELTSAYKEQQKTISDNITNIQSLNSEFEKLSKGVDEYGNNIALSTEEYNRYKEIISQILDISPELITGYDNEGNAIANKNDLIERSIELLKEEQKLKLLDMTTEDKNWTVAQGNISTLNNVSKDKGVEQKFNEIFNLNNKADKMASSVLGVSTVSGNYQGIVDNVEKIIDESQDKTSRYYKTLTDDQIKNLRDWSKEYIRKSKEIEDARKGFNSQLSLNAQSTDSYSKLNDSEKNLIENYVNSFKINPDTDYDGFITLTEQLQYKDDIVKMTNDVKNFVDTVANASEESKANINNLFTLDKSKMSAGDYKKQADYLIDIIAKEFEINPIELKLQLGMDSVDNLIDEAKKRVNTAEINSGYTAQNNTNRENFIESLSEEDLKILIEIDNIGTMSIDDIKKSIEDTKKSENDLSKQNEITAKTAEEMDKVYSDFTSTATSVSNVMKTISDGEKVDATTLLNLISKYPQYASEISKVNDSKEYGITVAKMLFEANKAQTLTELENQQKILKGERDILAVKNNIAGIPNEAIAGWKEANDNVNAGQANIDIVKNSSFEDFSKSSSSSKTEDLWKQEAEDKLKAIKHQVEMEEITEEDGLNRTEEIYKKYFSDLTKYQDEYNQYEEEVFNGRKELRQKEIDEQRKIVDDEISYLEEQKKNYEDLSAQLLEDSIKPIDEKIESLKKQNEELDKTNQLLDAQNKLENAKNKSVFTFNGSSWGYQEDTEAVKEAQDNLTKVEKDVEIDNLEKSKKDLEDKSSEAIDVISQFFDGLINVLDGKSPLQSNPEAYKNLQYTPATIDNIGKLNISDEAKKLFGLNIGTNLNGGLKNYTDFSQIGKQFNNTLLPVTNNESQKSLMIEKICDQIVLNDVKNANDFVAQLVNQLPTAISNYLKK